MTYFRELPDVNYPNFLNPQGSTSSQSYIRLKNLFTRFKLRDDLQNVFTVFNKYIIQGDERPDNVAQKLYGDPDLDWVVRITANIINLQQQWPLSSEQLYDYVVTKYGLSNVSEVQIWETVEVRNNQNKLILPAGKAVDKDFTIPNPDNPLVTINPVEGISNFEYETRLNDAKRTIYVLKREFLGQFLNDAREIATYGFNSEFVDPKLIQTTNPRITNP